MKKRKNKKLEAPLERANSFHTLFDEIKSRLEMDRILHRRFHDRVTMDTEYINGVFAPHYIWGLN